MAATGTAGSLYQSNPFATKFISPESSDYVFVDAATMPDGSRAHLSTIYTALISSPRKSGAIIGPHGSGKSTLLRNLHDAIGPTLHRCTPTEFTLPSDSKRTKSNGPTVRSFQLQSGSPVKSQLMADSRHWNRDSWISIDGYEQLSWLERLRLAWCLKSAKSGLLVTAHRSVRGIPTIFTTPSSKEIREKIISRLLAHEPELIPLAIGVPVDKTNATNLREHLFRLYDWYEDLER